MLLLHHISLTSPWWGREAEEERKGERARRVERGGSIEPVGRIDGGVSEESGSGGFTNSFNVRDVFIEEVRRHFFGNWLSFFQQHRLIHNIRSEVSNCCGHTVFLLCVLCMLCCVGA